MVSFLNVSSVASLSTSRVFNIDQGFLLSFVGLWTSLGSALNDFHLLYISFVPSLHSIDFMIKGKKISQDNETKGIERL